MVIRAGYALDVAFACTAATGFGPESFKVTAGAMRMCPAGWVRESAVWVVGIAARAGRVSGPL
ncbi:hypothetical protein DD235_13460 [Corticimicrobacter populi]|uniref:Uncharacterized protein n=1 Tax=Corticimicrobacter populi TaxID=2175229 RepID=A0A2V1JUP4_9BURK|nr:hypothetical protein DD235_13460 [Corticimicrobacter populi]